MSVQLLGQPLSHTLPTLAYSNVGYYRLLEDPTAIESSLYRSEP
jgi:hypothetical protein